MSTNWWGIGGKQLHPVLSRVSQDEIVHGIPGTPVEHHSAPYSLTEEFVSVYRMHPLIRDDYSFRRAADDQLIEQRTFDNVTDNTRWARQMRDVYEGRIDRLDLMIGMFAEPKPTGFGFSDTAFRIFILMASRRLKSDRYFGEDY